MTKYQFGFAWFTRPYRFADVEIVKSDEFDDVKAWVAKYLHKDGFLYPPLSHDERDGEIVLRTERPARMHRPGATHELYFHSDEHAADPHRTHASFITQLVGYVHGTWPQFADWWFDARVPIDCRDEIYCSPVVAEHFLSRGYERWLRWPTQEQNRFVNLLFMHNRALSYESDWEHFIFEYIVFDAVYRTAIELKLAAGIDGHSKRIGHLCGQLGLQVNETWNVEFARLRNSLFHEALWDGGTPGHARSGEAYLSRFHLRRLNKRLVSTILGYHNDFVRSSWWTFGAFVFEKSPDP